MNETYLVSFRRYDEYKLAVKQLLALGLIKDKKQAVFVTMLEGDRVQKLRGMGHDFPKSHLIGLFTPTEIASLTRDAGNDLYAPVKAQLQGMYMDSMRLLEQLRNEMSPMWMQGIDTLLSVFKNRMEMAIERENVLEAYEATRYLERQIAILKIDHDDFVRQMTKVVQKSAV